STGKYKVYIIDEVHMLTREAFNALLKTLEEPPAHSIFILATTEAHKLPETIISRTQRFEFKPIPKNQAVKHMQAIAKSEKIDITPGALELLAEFGSGSFRDSISLLDQLSTTGTPITEEDVRNILGIPAESAITEILDNVLSGDAKSILISVQGLKEQGVDAAAASAALSKLIRHKMVEGPAPASLSGLLKQLIETPASSHPYDHLEISLLESASQFSQPAVKTEPKNTPKSVPAAISPAKNIEQPAAKKQIVDISVWPQVIESARQRAASIYTALKLAEPEFSGDKLLLKFEFPLHQKKIEQSKNKALVAELVESLTGQKVIVECTVDKSAFSKRPAAKPSEDEPKTQLHSINNIFGAAEVVEA
ncbi:MAG TPA: AAA family ATPase, partial [Chitinophagaceae bacterium]|nr:AAA family ATPase [Chitinophagaceae bacterium]